RSDLVSLGSVLYQSLAGKTPFDANSMAAPLVAVIRTEPQPLAHSRTETPPELSELVSKLMSKKPQDRPASAESVADEFAKLEGRFAPSKTAKAETEPQSNQSISQAVPQSPNRGSIPLYAIGAALALGFVVFLASVLIEWKTPAGIVYVTIDSADSVTSVDVSQNSLVITDPNDGKKVEVTVDEANGKMRLEKAGFAAVLTEFNLSSPDGRNIAVKFIPESSGGRESDSSEPQLPELESGNSERRIAQWILEQGGSLQVWVPDNGSPFDVKKVDALPTEQFLVSRIAFDKVEREAGLAILAKLTSDFTLWMPGTDVTGACFEYLGEATKLEGLNLQDCRSIDPENVAMLSSAKNLRTLLLLNSNLGDEVAELAKRVPSLFHIEFGSQLTSRGLQALKNCQNVTEVTLLGCELIEPDDFRHLQSIPRLNQLTVDPRQLNSISLKHLAGIASLQILRVLDIDSTGSLDVAAFVGLSSIVELDLSYGAVGVDQLEPLKEMQSLRRLGLRGTGLSKEDLSRVSTLLPNCELVIDEGILPAANAKP
ncbi:MAG: hypothetical protein AAGG44_10675, partial [Planctomycetota bacterium]